VSIHIFINTPDYIVPAEFIPSLPDFISQKLAREKFNLSVQQLKDVREKHKIQNKKYHNKIFLYQPALEKCFQSTVVMSDIKKQTAEAKLIEIRLKNENTKHEIIESEYAKFYKEASYIFGELTDMPDKLKLTNDQKYIWNETFGKLSNRLQSLSEEH